MIKEEDTSIAMARIGNFRKFLDFGNSSDLEIKKMTYVFSDFSQVLKSDFYLLPIEYFDLWINPLRQTMRWGQIYLTLRHQSPYHHHI